MNRSLLFAACLLLLANPVLASDPPSKGGSRVRRPASSAKEHREKSKHGEKGEKSEKDGKHGKKGKDHGKEDDADKFEENADHHDVVGAGSDGKAADFAPVDPPDRPIDTILLLDSSGSMKKTDPQRLRDKAAKLFIRFLAPGDRVALIEFAEGVNQILPFTTASPENIEKIDAAVDGSRNDGHFTDFELPLDAALKLMLAEGRPGAIRAVLLMSDGRLDPHPDRGSAEQLSNKIFSEELPEFQRSKIILYTVGFGELADRSLLRKMADEGEGLHWYAPDVNTIHLGFSDLFLALRKPQVAPLEKGGFEIDPSVTEATFYITRKSADESVTMIDPLGARLTNLAPPPNFKWFKGGLFDIITISRPQAGSWQIEGVEDASGFAALVTDLQLQVNWPSSKVEVGDRAIITARLTEHGETVTREEIKETAFFKYRVVSEDGVVLASGPLDDTGEGRDKKAGDFVYTGEVEIPPGGNMKMFVSVVTPTFTRQQSHAFVPSEQFVQLTSVPPEEGHKGPEKIRVTLSGEARKLKDLDVTVLARNQNGRCWIPVKESDEEGVFEGTTAILPEGRYRLVARVEGLGAKAKGPEAREIEEFSPPLTVTAAGPGDCALEKIATTAETGSNIGAVLLALSGSFLWCFGLYRYALKKKAIHVATETHPVTSTLDPALTSKLDDLRRRASDTRRSPAEEDYLRFALVPGGLDNPQPIKRPGEAAPVEGSPKSAPSPTESSAESAAKVPENKEAAAPAPAEPPPPPPEQAPPASPEQPEPPPPPETPKPTT